jgi:hypothetical protein
MTGCGHQKNGRGLERHRAAHQTGLTVTEMLPKAHEGELKALYIIGENPLVSDPDLNHAEKSLSNLEFLVVQDIFLTETAQPWPTWCCRPSALPKKTAPSPTPNGGCSGSKGGGSAGEAKDDWEITCEIATRMGYPMDYAGQRDHLRGDRPVTPSYAGITYARIERVGSTGPAPPPSIPEPPFCTRRAVHPRQGAVPRHRAPPPAEITDDEEYPICPDHRAAALPLPYRHHDHENRRAQRTGPGKGGVQPHPQLNCFSAFCSPLFFWAFTGSLSCFFLISGIVITSFHHT